MAKRRNRNTKPEIKDQQILKTTIERIHLLRSVRDIAEWRMALRMAETMERPDRTMLYRVYKEISDDPHLSAVCQKIVFRCTNSRIWWKVDGERADKEHPLNQLTGMSYFMDMVAMVVESRLYGHSLIQLNFLLPKFSPDTDEGVELVHRPNVRPEFGDILPRQGDESNRIEFRKPPYSNFLMEVGKRRDLGLLNKAAPEVLYKRFGVIDWHEFLEIYGMPIQEIQYDPNNPSNRTEAIKALEGQGSNSKIVTPIGSNYSLHDTAKAGSSDAFERNADYHNKEISKLFLLGTGTTEGIGSRSQGETHQSGEDEAVWAYQLMVEMVLNEKLKPILQRHGWQAEDGGEFSYGDTERLKKTALADILTKVAAVADVPMSYIYERFNIPAPTKEDKVKDNTAIRAQTPDIDKGEKKKLMADLTLNLPGPDNCCESGIYTNVGVTLAFDNTKVTKQEKNLLKKIWEGVTSNGKIPRQHFQELSSLLLSGVQEGWPSPSGTGGTDWDSPDHLRRSLLEANVQRFSAAKDLAMVQQLNEIKNGAEGFADFKSQAQPILGNFNANWLRAEYNHAVATSQNAAAYLRHLDDADIFPYWRYETIGDKRVRAEHAALDGKVFSIKDTEALKFYPPNGFNCRCGAIPTDKGIPETVTDAIEAVGGGAWQRMIDKGFAQNFGDTLRIFDRNMEYLQGFDPNQLTYESFLLLPFSDLPALSRLAKKPLNSQQAARWFEDRRGGRGLDTADAVRLTDYRKRPVLLQKTTVDDLVLKAQGGHLNELEQVLSNPDEVWLLEGNALVRRYIKFYEGKVMGVEAVFSKNNPEGIRSISLIEDNVGGLVDTLRKGILIKS